MENLPALLLSTIKSASEQFKNVSFTVHGETDRARISIVFSNQDSAINKRKSNATVKRDIKRMKEHNEARSNSNQVTDTKSSEPMVTETVEPVIQFCENNVKSTDNKNKQIKVSKSETLKPSSSKSDSGKSNFQVQNLTANSIDKDSTSTECIPGKLTENTEERNSEVDDYFSKIVVKKCRCAPDILIGKTIKTHKLVLYNTGHDKFEVLYYGDNEFDKYNKVLTEDFKDVRETNLMTKTVEKGIIKLKDFVMNNKL